MQNEVPVETHYYIQYNITSVAHTSLKPAVIKSGGAAGGIRFGRVLHLGSWIEFYKGSFPNAKAIANAPTLNSSLRLGFWVEFFFSFLKIKFEKAESASILSRKSAVAGSEKTEREIQ
ncbi:hypothetical protein [Saccharibacillus endophyticus]|uniref:Uncharacterized protein n=1 Tax=Saccharibacillus endophyticus TaxID=2060666 RepID=A0ABQ2A3J6_9BACL|nr:hypothetical protein [Saccharibacillus endophyticus]GGH83587.1 hypothetical protein GCM10007362_36660 [Saccharibacillus endophyticus]